ncbi:MAG: HNH endonuclease [Butyricicoccaceae bacterium]
MPNMPMHPCAHVGCWKLTTARYCAEHQQTDPRAVRHKMYGSRQWARIRQDQLMREPFCRSCAAQGRRVRATEVDHIIPHRGDASLFADKNNLQSLCKRCHSMKTMQEINENGGM